MKILPKAITKLTESFEKLPGLGPRTAQRLVFYLLHVPQEELDNFSDHLKNLKTQTLLCSVCKNVAEMDPCPICSDPSRDKHLICVVENPTDVLALEKTGKFHGLYHVLHGEIDPLNNIGPDEIFIDDLFKRITQNQPIISEIILATNPTMEGEATAMFIQKKLSLITAKNHPPDSVQGKQPTVKLTRLAHGLPVGADIEYADEVTLSRALEGRNKY